MVIEDQYVIIDDKYPKARLHGLVVARDPALLAPTDLSQEHLPLLAAMKVCILSLLPSQPAIQNLLQSSSMQCVHA